MEPGFSPRDEEWRLGASPYPEPGQSWMLRVGIQAAFGKAATLLEALTGLTISERTIQRWTEQVGAEAMQMLEADQAHLHQVLPESTRCPEQCADGAMVPLVHGVYAEMKLRVVGTPHLYDEEVQLEDQTDVARITDAATFTDRCYPEWHRRGDDGAPHVAVVSDGAEWMQHLIEAYRPDAVRMLDAMPACQHLSTIGQLLFPNEAAVAERWYQRPRDRLLKGQRDLVLARLHRYPAIAEEVAYLDKRADMRLYALRRAAGWPMGSGSAESANRHLMQARLQALAPPQCGPPMSGSQSPLGR